MGNVSRDANHWVSRASYPDHRRLDSKLFLAEKLPSELSFFDGKENTYRRFQDPHRIMTSRPCPAFLLRLTISKPPLQAILDIAVPLRLELSILDLDLDFRFWKFIQRPIFVERAPFPAPMAMRVGAFERLLGLWVKWCRYGPISWS
jgi:hypothetical protein